MLRLKHLLFFLSIFALQSILLLILLLRPFSASADIGVRVAPQDKDNVSEANCTCSPKNSGSKMSGGESVRLFIPIPMVTDACGYVCDVSGDKKGNVVDYVVQSYKFLVGLAAHEMY